MGKPGFPISPPARVWEGEALEHGAGETWFPHTPAGGRVWEGKALEQAAWGNQVSPRPRWREGLALPHPVRGFGRDAPSKVLERI